MINAIDKAKQEGDSVGGVFEVVASGLPYGLGSHVQWDKKLHARIAESIMSVNAFKGIEIGMGFESGRRLGSDVHDEISWDGEKYIRFSNNAGGIEGGMSNAQPMGALSFGNSHPAALRAKPPNPVKTKEKQSFLM